METYSDGKLPEQLYFPYAKYCLHICTYDIPVNILKTLHNHAIDRHISLWQPWPPKSIVVLAPRAYRQSQ